MENLSQTKFDTLEKKISKKTMKAIKEMGFETMTEIQAKAIPMMLEYKDVGVCAKTGSGKTLTFLIPAVELLNKLKWRIYQWTGIVILSPTRELAMQTYEVLKKLLKYHSFTHILLMGGNKRKEEAESLAMSKHIVVATPGRLLDHLQNTPKFIIKNLQCLIIDEADRMLDFGFEEEIKGILNIFNTQTILRQARLTFLFSATLNSKTKEFMQVALHKTTRYIGMEEAEKATVEGLYQNYIICPSEKRFNLLHCFLITHRKKKVMVFFNSCNSVRFHNDLFNYVNFHVGSIHGKLKQNLRNRALRKFRRESTGILFCTNIAARGLDIPMVDLIIQYDPPDNITDYIHRVGRTARGVNGIGQAFLFIRPEEKSFIKYLRQKKVPICDTTIFWNLVPDLFSELEKVVCGNYHFKQVAKEAFMSYIRAYKSHQMKTIFDESTLDHKDIANSFGFPRPPFNFSKNPR